MKQGESEGEEFIADFLRLVKIKFIQQYAVEGLVHDNANYRIADFYLPGYGVYIEFEGLWSHPDYKARYAEKRKVYEMNKVPCIYLYPENLGFIEFSFDKRLQAVLRKFNMTDGLRKYHWKKLLIYQYESMILASLGIFVLPFINWDQKSAGAAYFIIAIVLYQVAKIVSAFYRIFHLDRYPLKRYPS